MHGRDRGRWSGWVGMKNGSICNMPTTPVPMQRNDPCFSKCVSCDRRHAVATAHPPNANQSPIQLSSVAARMGAAPFNRPAWLAPGLDLTRMLPAGSFGPQVCPAANPCHEPGPAPCMCVCQHGCFAAHVAPNPLFTAIHMGLPLRVCEAPQLPRSSAGLIPLLTARHVGHARACVAAQLSHSLFGQLQLLATILLADIAAHARPQCPRAFALGHEAANDAECHH